MGCSASTTTSVSSTQVRTMDNPEPTLAGRSKTSAVSNIHTSVTKTLPQVNRPSVISGTRISTKTPKEKISPDKKYSRDSTGRKSQGNVKESKAHSPYSVDLTKEMKPIRRVSGGSQNSGREGVRRSTASITRKAESDRILEEEPVNYIVCSTKTPREALPPIRTAHTGSSAPGAPPPSSQQQQQDIGLELQKLDASVPLSPIPTDKQKTLGVDRKTSEPNGDGLKEDTVKNCGDKLSVNNVSGESKAEEEEEESGQMEYVNGDISGHESRIELVLRSETGDVPGIEGSDPQGEGDNKTFEADGQGGEVQLVNRKNLQSNDGSEIVVVADDRDPEPTLGNSPATEDQGQIGQNQIEKGSGGGSSSSSGNSGNGQQHRHHHHHHHHHHHQQQHQHQYHHHHHRRGHPHQHQHLQAATQSDQRLSTGSGGSGGSVSPEKTIKIMSKDAKTQFVFRAIKSRDEESDNPNDTRDMLIQTDVISINDNNEKSKKKLLINLKRLGSKDEAPKHRLTRGHEVELTKELPQSNHEGKGHGKNAEDNHKVSKEVKDKGRDSQKKQQQKDQEGEVTQQPDDASNGTENAEQKRGAGAGVELT
ncbi:hypothetical protein RRG08_005906 [Elysia crispata]|uniref:Uncharacterized protein n=1 Tax=Elysia crispata TaxID=231223 RepID=A0AAE0Y622_9GAST|nr:hypothetical protein RRG08_005906 [Elysia crispata]